MAGETIQHFIDSGDTMDVWCHNCHHHSPVDMLKLRDRLGPDHGCMHDDIVHLFYCTRCDGKRIGFTRRPDYDKVDRDRMTGRNLYAKAKGD